jgi:dCMP deaminase
MNDKWLDRFMGLAFEIASWTTCLRRGCGAILVKDKHIIATGYNGAPQGCLECSNIGECIREENHIPSGERQELCRATHAEQNAICQAAKFGISTDGATMFINTQPCAICAKMMINAGIKEVYYCGDYPDALALELLAEAGVFVQKRSGKDEE